MKTSPFLYVAFFLLFLLSCSESRESSETHTQELRQSTQNVEELKSEYASILK